MLIYLILLDVSRGKSPIDIWGDAREAAGGQDVPIRLLDDSGNVYVPIGWIWNQSSQKKINLTFDPRRGVDAISEIPNLSASGKDGLDLIFQVPEGRKLVAVLLGDTTICRLDLSS